MTDPFTLLPRLTNEQTDLGFVLFGLLVLAMIVYTVVRAVRGTRKARAFQRMVQPGDFAYVSVHEGINGTVVAVDDEQVTLTITVYKSRISTPLS